MALMKMPDDPAGRDLLKALNLSGFASASSAMFDSIRELASQVGAGPH
jgi:ABC-type phosphate/phosphonate transport system substrate-binding protein